MYGFELKTTENPLKERPLPLAYPLFNFLYYCEINSHSILTDAEQSTPEADRHRAWMALSHHRKMVTHSISPV